MSNLLDRCKQFMDVLGISVTNFCKRVHLSRSGFYAWKTGRISLSDATRQRIDNYLKQYHF